MQRNDKSKTKKDIFQNNFEISSTTTRKPLTKKKKNHKKKKKPKGNKKYLMVHNLCTMGQAPSNPKYQIPLQDHYSGCRGDGGKTITTAHTKTKLNSYKRPTKGPSLLKWTIFLRNCDFVASIAAFYTILVGC